MGPTRTNDIGHYATSTAKPRHNMGRTQHRQIQTGKRVPRSLYHSRPDQRVAGRTMVRYKYVYWCISHQQYVEPSARRNLRDQLRCRIVRLNLTLLRQLDFDKLSTWINLKHFSRRSALSPRN